jgi:hypothetical protein
MDNNNQDAVPTSPEVSAFRLPRLTPSGRLRQGYEYQDVQAISLLVDWLADNNRYRWVKLENDDDSGFLDDINVMRADGVLEAWQVKFSTQSHSPTDVWTWEALLKQKRGAHDLKSSLLQKWFDTWQHLVGKGLIVSPCLVSNRRAAPELALDTPYDSIVRWHEIPEDAQKIIAEQLGGEALAREFFDVFRFHLDKPSLRALEEGAWLRFRTLGGTSDGWYALEKSVREWGTHADLPSPDGLITLDELRRVAKLKAHPVRLQTFLPPEMFFARHLEPQRLFHHRLPQVGRRNHLNDLLGFVEGKAQIAILPGRGGCGKSKLIHTLWRRLRRRRPDLSVRLVGQSQSLKEESLDELPDDNCLVVVDDAHRPGGLEVLLRAAWQNPALKVLLVTRPHATEYLAAQARYAGFDFNDIVVYKSLPNLDYRREHRRLSRLVLGADWVQYADRLASVTRDSPLLTVLGGQLLRTEQVAPSFLSRNNKFRQEVLSRFRDIRLGEIISMLDGRFTARECAEVLPLVAAVSPLDLEHADLIRAMARLAGMDEVRLKQLLGLLVEAEALAQGGRLVRIVPDVLSDFILHEACFASGVLTGWANHVYEALADFRLDIVLRNFAELDWRIRTMPSEENSTDAPMTSETGLLDSIWQDIEKRFRSGSLLERKAWLGRLERIAFMQPSRVWPLVEITLGEPVPVDPDEVSPALKPWVRPTTQSDVLASLGPVLRGVACDDRFTARCADLLWEMGRDLQTEPGYSPSAISTLRQLASYERQKPLVYNQIVLDCCREWMDDPNVHTHQHSILEILSPMLARRVDWSEMDGLWLSYGSVTLSPEPLREFRRGALELVERCALTGRRPLVLAALNALNIVITEQDLFELREREPSLWHAWEEEQMAALDVVARVAQSNFDPFVRLKIWDVLEWQAERGPRPVVRDRAREILEALPHSFESRLILLMTLSYGWEQYHRTWDTPEETDEAWLKADHAGRQQIDQKRHERNAEFARQVTARWVELYPNPKEGFEALGSWIEQIETYGWWNQIWTRSNPFMLRLAADFPWYARAWCETALEMPEARATEMCDDLLCTLRLQDAVATLRLAQRFLEHGHPNLLARVAGSYSWPGWPLEPLPEEWEILNSLLSAPHSQVRHTAASVVSSIASADMKRAMDLVFAAEVGEDSDFADKLFESFEERRGFDFDDLTSAELSNLLEKLKTVGSLKSYHLGRFLLMAALRDPVAVAGLLLSRVRRKVELNRQRMEQQVSDDRLLAKQPVDEFVGLPKSGFHDDRLREVVGHPDYPAALRLIRDAALTNEYNSALLWEDTLSELFRDFSLSYCSTSLDVLNEWIDSGDCRLVRSAMRLLGDTYLGFYVSNLPFVSNYLRHAKECGRVVLEEVERAMLHCAEYGPPRAMASHRGERSNALFRMAQEAIEKIGGDALSIHFFRQLKDKGQQMIESERKKEAEEEIFFRS